ncbi:MAG: sulfate adenylyltransferase, partial [Anaerolineae bacterium]|nr:sulfate adenylyltransferase [Anaerolineae bacterium]
MTDTNNTYKLIAPHGGVLVNRLLDGELRDVMRERAQAMTQIPLSPMNIADLECIATGVYSPLTGYMGSEDYNSVVHDMHLSGGLPWTVPLTLAVDDDLAAKVKVGQTVTLAEPNGNGGLRNLAVMTITEKYAYDEKVEAQKVYGTTDEAHPGVTRIYTQGDTYLAGDIWVFDRPLETESFADIR